MLAAVGSLALAVAFLTPVEQYLRQLREFMPIKYVRVEGSFWYLDADEFQAAVAPCARDGYFTVDLAGVQAAARSLAWVADVKVTRVWPDTLVARVLEHRPVARWGNDSLIDDAGRRFRPEAAARFDELPRLEGPDGQERTVLDKMRSLNAKLAGRQLHIDSLRLSNRLAWVADLRGGTRIVFGNQDPEQALERLLALLPQLGEERVATIKKLDLRYPNGFAVVWKPAPPTAPESAWIGQPQSTHENPA